MPFSNIVGISWWRTNILLELGISKQALDHWDYRIELGMS
jgi:hypothetical protein